MKHAIHRFTECAPFQNWINRLFLVITITTRLKQAISCKNYIHRVHDLCQCLPIGGAVVELTIWSHKHCHIPSPFVNSCRSESSPLEGLQCISFHIFQFWQLYAGLTWRGFTNRGVKKSSPVDIIKFLSVRELGTFRNASMLAYLSNCYNNYDLFKSELVALKLTLYAKFPFWKGEIDGKPDLHFLDLA